MSVRYSNMCEGQGEGHITVTCEGQDECHITVACVRDRLIVTLQ